MLRCRQEGTRLPACARDPAKPPGPGQSDNIPLAARSVLRDGYAGERRSAGGPIRGQPIPTPTARPAATQDPPN